MKNILTLMTCIVAIALTGCNLSESQQKVIAQNAGLAAAVTWIAYDNPSSNETKLVSQALDVIREGSVTIVSGQTYTEFLFKDVESFARSEQVPKHYAPIVIAGSLAALNGIDLMFAANPSWAETQAQALGIVNSFVIGAKHGLSLADDDPRIKNARLMQERRAKTFVQ